MNDESENRYESEECCPFIIHHSSFIIAQKCRRQDLNLHILRYEILSLARLPISPLRPAFCEQTHGNIVEIGFVAEPIMIGHSNGFIQPPKISYFCTMRTSLTLLACVFFISLQGKTAGAQPTKPIQSGQHAYLEIRPEYEGALLTFPTCVAMTLNFYGMDTSQWTAKRVDLELGLHYDEMGKSIYTGKQLEGDEADYFNGTSFKDIQGGIKKMGYTWDKWQWPDDNAGFRNALNAIEQSLDRRNPVIIGEAVHFSNKKGKMKDIHKALLAFGYDEKVGELFVMSPTMQFPGKRHIPFDELKHIWDWDGHYRALFTAPVGKLPTGHKE